jgi:DNA processing protein
MTNTTDNYLLLLNSLFHDQPKRIYDCQNLYSDISSFKQNLSTIFSTLNIKPETQSYIKSKITYFDPISYKAKLKQLDIHTLFLHSEQYPPLLKEIHAPPPVLFYKGDPALLSDYLLAVVGPRKYTDYAKHVTTSLVSALTPNFIIISGLAEGIDSLAHNTALENGYPTIAVVGTGLDTVYPKFNEGLFNKICKNGVVISEYPPGTQPNRYRFPQRNRLISGLSRGVLISEASEKSGTLVTARHAIEQNREVFAVPGSIFSEQSKGVHRLIQDGAKLIQSHEDILAEFSYLIRSKELRQKKPKPKLTSQLELLSTKQQELEQSLSKEEKDLLSFIGDTPLSLDEIGLKSKMPVHQLLQYLMLFELNGIVEQLPGKRFQKVVSNIA